MSRERFQRVESLFLAASELPPEERAAFLRGECGSDTALLDEVEGMLAHDRDTPLEGPNDFRGKLQEVLDSAQAASVGIPAKIGRYDVVRRIGLGGMGAVYEAEQSEPRRRVALKVVRPDAMSGEMLGRFRHETELLGRLQHRGIAQIFEAGTFDLGDGEQPFFAMEFVDGVPIQEYARDLGSRDRLALFAEVCDAVHHAHQQGVIHRDLKTENVLVTGDGHPKILDFGVGRMVDAEAKTSLTMAGQIIGTLASMSPEQVGGSPELVDTRSDVYALGVILYELVTGKPPFDLGNVSIAEAGRIICEEDPPRLEDKALQGDVEAIVRMALEKEKARRYSSANGLAQDIRRYLADLPISARPATTWYQIRKFARRHRVAFAGATATLLALTIGLVSTAIQAVRATNLARVAEGNEREAQRTAYRASIAAASSALALGEGPTVRWYLDQTPNHLRDWEWRHLDAQLDVTEAVYAPGLQPAVASEPGTRIAFTADGTPVSLQVADRSLALIDVRTGERLHTIRLESAPRAVAMDERGARVAVLDAGWKLRVGEARTGALRTICELKLAGEPRGLRFSPSGSSIYAADEREFVVASVAGGTIRARHTVPDRHRFEAARFVGPEDRIAVPLFQRRLRVFDSRTGATVRERKLPSCGASLSPSPDGRLLAVAMDPLEHVIRILDAATLTDVAKVGGHPHSARCVAYSNDGGLLASGSTERLVIHDASTFEKKKTLFVPGLDPRALRWSPDGRRILVRDGAGAAWLLRWDPSAYLEFRGHGSYVYVAAWSPDGNLIASGAWDGTVRLWDARSGALLATFSTDTPWISFVAFAGDGNRVIATVRGRYVAWDVATGRQQTLPIGAKGERWAMEDIAPYARGGSKWVRWSAAGQTETLSPDNRLCFSLGELSEVESGRVRFELEGYDKTVRGVAINHAGDLMAIGGADGKVRLRNTSNGSLLAEMEGPTVTRTQVEPGASDIFSVEFSPDGRRLVSGGDDARVSLWDLESRRAVLALQPHESYVHVVAFSPDGTRILSGSGDGTLRVWGTTRRSERVRGIRAAAVRRAAAKPLVDRLLAELGDAQKAADAIREDPKLSPKTRQAALRVLLAHCMRGR